MEGGDGGAEAAGAAGAALLDGRLFSAALVDLSTSTIGRTFFWTIATVTFQADVFQFFHSSCLKYCACREKVMPSHTKCCTCHAKSSQQT